MVVTAGPCLQAEQSSCRGEALEAYRQIDDLAGAVSFLRDSVTEGHSMYTGELPEEVAGRYDATLNAGTVAAERSRRAQETCLPSFPAECADANEALRDALDDLYKLFNEWRRDCTRC